LTKNNKLKIIATVGKKEMLFEKFFCTGMKKQLEQNYL